MSQRSPQAQNRADALALCRLVCDVRGMLESASPDDPDVAGLLADCDAAERVANWISVPAIKLTDLHTGSSA